MKKTTFYLLFGFAFLFAMATAEDCNSGDDDCTCAIDCPDDTCDPAVDTVPCVNGDALTGGDCSCTKSCPTDSCTDAESKETCADDSKDYCTCALADKSECHTATDPSGVCTCDNTCATVCDETDACTAIDEDYCSCPKSCPTDTCPALTLSCTATDVPTGCTCTDDTGSSCDTDDTATGGTCACTKPALLSDACGGTSEPDCLCFPTSGTTPCDATTADCLCNKQCTTVCDKNVDCAAVDEEYCACTKSCPTDSCTDAESKETCADDSKDYCTCTLADKSECHTATDPSGVCTCENTCAVCDDSADCVAIDEAGCTCTKPCTESTCTNDGDTCTDPTTDANCKCTKGSASVTSSTIINIMLPLVVMSYKLFNYVIV